MKTAIFAFFIFASLLALGERVSAQEKKEIPQRLEQRNYYRKTLQLDSVKAEQVAQVQADYKKSLAIVAGDSALTDKGRRAKIDLLIAEKNRRLKTILTPSQQQKVIPTTEREPAGAVKQF